MKIREIHVVGAGSLGSFTVQLLVKMNPIWRCPTMVWDFDKVEEHNVNNQLYQQSDTGNFKVDSLSAIVKNLGGPNLVTLKSAVDEKTDFRGVVIVAVDSMAARKNILESCKFNAGVDYLIEGRMGGHLSRVFGLDPKHPEAIERYRAFLYDDKDAQNPICATNETVPALWIASAAMVKMLLLYCQAPFLRNNFVHTEINLSSFPVVNSNSYALI